MYYLVLSPWIEKTIGLDKMEKDYGFDASVYKGKITPSILDYFKNEFKHEYQ
jgi:hypothetical protein